MSGMTAIEREIMAVWDDGGTYEEIHRRAGHKMATIKTVISRLHVSGREEEKARIAAAEQNCDFLAAMRKFQPTQVTS